VLPPQHRVFWQFLETVRKQDIQSGNEWKYEADPFLAKRQREAKLKQLEIQKAEAETKKRADEERGFVYKDAKDKKWEGSPIVEMNLSSRRLVEHVIRNNYKWPRQSMSAALKNDVVERLLKLGFRTGHAEEACEFAKDLEEALEWLLIYVPEDDLPPRFLPRDYSTGLSLVTPTQESLALEYAAERTIPSLLTCLV